MAKTVKKQATPAVKTPAIKKETTTPAPGATCTNKNRITAEGWKRWMIRSAKKEKK
ncbi:MAG: hypothetical protein NTZ52_00865 [Chlamydiae bacterium]|nr:hypothetical protein [Chlamydiota bacterium]